MKLRIFFIILILTVTQAAFSSEFKEVEDTEINFKWAVEGENLHIILSAPTEGWISVGFNPSKVMKDADFKLAYVQESNTVIEDHFGTGLFGHKNDSSIGGTSDFVLINGSEINGMTTVEFMMPLNSGDEFDSLLQEGDEVKVLLAYSTRDDFARKHKKRTSIIIEL